MPPKKKDSTGSRDELVRSLKEYNDDLDKFLPKVNFDYLKDDILFDEDYLAQESRVSSNISSHTPAYNSDMSTLVANNVIDVKSEIVLLRKNIIDNVASIVSKTVADQENQFLKRLNDAFATLNANFREGINSSISNLYDDMSSIKKEVDRISINTQKLNSKMDEIFENNLEIKTAMSGLGDFKNKINATGGFESISKRFSVIEDRLSRVIKNNELQIDKFSTVLKYNNEKIDGLLDGLKSSGLDIAEESINNLREVESNNSLVSSKLDERLNKLLLDDDSKKSSSKMDWDNSDFNSSVNSAINIDSKLKKLNSLR